MSDDHSGENGFRLRMIGFGIFLALSPIYALFSHYNQEDRGFLVVSIAVVFCAVAYVKRGLLRAPLFSMVLMALAAVQLSAAVMVPIPARYPGFVMIPLAFADLLVVLALMSLVERRIGS